MYYIATWYGSENLFAACTMWAALIALLRLCLLCVQVQHSPLEGRGRETRPEEKRGLAAGQVTQLNSAGTLCPHLTAPHQASCWSTPPVQVFEVIKIINHNDFNPQTKENDVTLLKLNRPLTFNNWVRPIDICVAALRENQPCTLTGWGATRESEWK